MSRIDQLISELCPEGVKVYRLGDLIEENLGGGTPSRSQPYFWDGEIAWASVGDLTASHLEIRSARQSITQRGLEASSTNLIPEGWVIAAVKIAPGEMRVVKSPVAINQDLRGLRLKSSLDPRFLVFLSKTLQVSSNGTIVKGITNDSLKRIPIPLPPLEVQKEIVSILDKFTQLEAELEAELEARKTQYEVTRDRLLDFSCDLSAHPMGEKIRELCPEGVPFRSLGGLVQTQTPAGKIPRSKFLKNGSFPIVDQSQAQIAGYTDDKSLVNDFGSCVVFGDHTREIKYVDFPFAAGADGTVILLPTGEISARYLFYSLQSLRIQSRGYNRHWSVVKELQISIPPIEVQREIVSLLDKLDALVNDITYGLPAEIEARRKQYEYYRNKLLTFKELDAA